MVGTFLARFDYIFTLNQDLLLEHHYLNGDVGRGKFSGWQMPGLKPLNPTTPAYDPARRQAPMMTPDDQSTFRVSPGRQPYIKLHGSSNWMRSSAGTRLLVLGGGKEIEIKREPLLNWYQNEFAEVLRRPEAKLMVIGYSFGDDHVNRAITEAVEAGHGLKLFIVDPEGVGVLDKWKNRLGVRPSQVLEEKLGLSIRGASRRALSSTFGQDRVEHAKLLGFLA